MFVRRFQRLALALTLLLLARGPGWAQTDAPPHYYDAAIGKTGPALKAALQNIIKGQIVIPYTSSTNTDTWAGLKALDEAPGNPASVVLVYAGLTALKSDQYTGSSGTWSREHLWPQSFGLTALSANSRAKSDLFILRPINTGVNSSRGNKYYDISTAPVTYPANAPGSSYDGDSWEPRDGDKGALARACFYMAVRYDGSDPDVPDLELSDTPDPSLYRFGKLSALLAWHRQFAVTAGERLRNQMVYTIFQHNRNPFVDHPDYADMVFLGASANQAWMNRNFTAEELTNPAISNDAADPDSDGVSNLLEYFFNRDPRSPELTPAVTTSVTNIAGARSVLLSFTFNRNATDVNASYESSSDLQNWSPASGQVAADVVTSSETEQLTVAFPAPTNQYFVRVRLSRSLSPQNSVGLRQGRAR